MDRQLEDIRVSLKFDGKASFTTLDGDKVTPTPQIASAQVIGDVIKIVGEEPDGKKTKTKVWDIPVSGLNELPKEGVKG